MTNSNEKKHIIPGRNAVLEALRSSRTIESIFIASDRHYKSMSQIIKLAKENKILIKEVATKKLEALSEGVSHQGVVAIASDYVYSKLDDIFEVAKRKNQDPFIVIADGIEDPHNLGAIIRTVECVGAHGVIIPSRRATGLTLAVEKTSAGAVTYVPIIKVTNIANVIDDLKERGVWIFGAEAGGPSSFETDLTGPVAIVIGSEGKGISRLVKEKCDRIVSLPLRGKISSLNASVAAGVILYEVLRRVKRTYLAP